MGDAKNLQGLIDRLTGGRPMTKVGYAFTDRVNGLPVFIWVDRLGRYYLGQDGLIVDRMLCDKKPFDVLEA